MEQTDESRIAVVALGGNAISSPDEVDTIANQFRHTRSALQGVAELLHRGYRLAVTHGNGPQVGNALLRVELSNGRAPELPLGVIVADTQGGMGYMIEQCLQNVFLRMGYGQIEVVTLVTQVLVDPKDPALTNPTKFVGQFYSENDAKLKAEQGWVVRSAGYRGFRRVVGSPMPLEILNRSVIKQLVHSGTVVVAAGGGGVPVYRERDGWLEGVDAVIDKDRASAVLARDIQAHDLFIVTAAEFVSLNYGTPEQKDLSKLRVSEAERYLGEGHFPAGSMGPKVEAAVKFLREGGSRVLICDLEKFVESLDGKSGTWIYPD